MKKEYRNSPCAGTWPQKWSMSKLQKGNGFRMQNRALTNYIIREKGGRNSKTGTFKTLH